MASSDASSKKRLPAGYRDLALWHLTRFFIPLQLAFALWFALIGWLGGVLPALLFSVLWLGVSSTAFFKPRTFCPSCHKTLTGPWVCPYCDEVQTMHPTDRCPSCDRQADAVSCPRCAAVTVFDAGPTVLAASSDPLTKTEVEEYAERLRTEWEKSRLKLSAEVERWKAIAQFEQEQLVAIDAMSISDANKETLRKDLKDFLRHERYQ